MPVTLLTDLAETKLATAAGSGSQVAITHIALGDANGVTYDPAADATALRNERVRRAIDSTAFQGGNTWIVKAEFPTDTPSFAVREIGFFDQDGDLIAIWAGADVEPRQTGVIVYLIEHALSFSRVAEGRIIVDAPWDNEIRIGHMILARAGLSFEGYLECDGSLYDETLYPNLALAGYTALAPADVIDLGADGQLIFPVTVKWGDEDHTYYVFDRDKNGVSQNDNVSLATLAATLNGGTPVDETLANRSGTINGVDVIIPLLGDAFALGSKTPTPTADPTVNNTTYTDMLAIWDAFVTTGETFGTPAGWANGYWLTATATGDGANPYASLWTGNGSVHKTTDAGISYHQLAFEVPNPPLQTIYPLPDSAALGAPTGYSYYIRHGGF